MSLRQGREKNISSVSSLPATPILHQFLPVLLLLKGFHTLDRTAVIDFCSERRQSGCIRHSGWQGPCSSASSVPRPKACRAAAKLAPHLCARVQGFLPQQAHAALWGLRSCSSLLRTISGQEGGGWDSACQGGKVCCWASPRQLCPAVCCSTGC